MAFANYNATNNNWSTTFNLTNNRDYVIFNGSQCPMDVSVVSAVANANQVTFPLESGEGTTYHAQAGGSYTFTGTPAHTNVLAEQAFIPIYDQGEDEGSGSRLVIGSY